LFKGEKTVPKTMTTKSAVVRQKEAGHFLRKKYDEIVEAEILEKKHYYTVVV